MCLVHHGINQHMLILPLRCFIWWCYLSSHLHKVTTDSDAPYMQNQMSTGRNTRNLTGGSPHGWWHRRWNERVQFEKLIQNNLTTGCVCVCAWNPQTLLGGKLVLWHIELAFNCGVLASIRSESSRCRDRRFAKAECESSDCAAFLELRGILVNGLRCDMFIFWGDSFNFQLLVHAQRSGLKLKSYKSYGTQTDFDQICEGFLLMTVQSYSSLEERWCIPWFVVVPFRWFTSLDNGKRIAVFPSQCWKCVGKHFLQSHFFNFLMQRFREWCATQTFTTKTVWHGDNIRA